MSEFEEIVEEIGRPARDKLLSKPSQTF